MSSSGSGGSSSAGSAVAGREYSADGRRVWRVGTLEYTRPQLANVFFWLLWGDFVLALMDNGVFSQVVALQLRKLGASNAAIGFLNGTVMSVMTALLISVVSTASDRTRTRMGRRLPYLLWSTPPLAACLIAIGYSAELAKLLEGAWPGGARGLAWVAGAFLPGVGVLPGYAALVIGMMALLVTLYKFFDLFPQSIYYYLWADVVPARLMGSFVCLFRVVAAVGMWIFDKWVLGWADAHPERVYLGAALLYLFSFILMCLMVKEGTYPPIEDTRPASGAAKRGFVARVYGSVWGYLRECFSHSYYVKFYAMNACFIVAIKSLSFLIFFGTQGMGLTPARYGEIVSWRNVASLVPALVLGPIVDRYHPIRIGVIASVVLFGASLASFFFIRGETSFAWLVVATYAATSIYQAGTGALLPRLLPREKYGQFASANAVVFHLAWALGAWVCGRYLDWVTGNDPATGKPSHPENYRYLFLWFAGIVGIGVWLSFDVYRHWKRLGGDEGYEPPVVKAADAAGFEGVGKMT